jgi:hypothetical protein
MHEPYTDNNVIDSMAFQSSTMKANVAQYFGAITSTANMIILPALPLIAWVAVGEAGLYSALIGEALNTKFGRKYATRVLDEELNRFVTDNFKELAQKWHGFSWQLERVKNGDVINSDGQPVLLPIASFPPSLKRPIQISAFKVSARASLGGSVVALINSVIKKIPFPDPKP